MVIPVVPSYFDNAHKLLTIKGQPYVGMVTYGSGRPRSGGASDGSQLPARV